MGIKQNEESELSPGRVTMKRLMSSHDDCRLPCVSHLGNRFISKLSILEISSAENKLFGECYFLNFLCRSKMNARFNGMLETQSNKHISFESRPFQIHIKYLDYTPTVQYIKPNNNH